LSLGRRARERSRGKEGVPAFVSERKSHLKTAGGQNPRKKTLRLKERIRRGKRELFLGRIEKVLPP